VAFHAGLEELRTIGANQRCAILCAETPWWRCHRRIITDYLLNAGETVFHILGSRQIEQVTMTPRPATPTTLVHWSTSLSSTPMRAANISRLRFIVRLLWCDGLRGAKAKLD
jgi:hypothetical protein